MDTSRFGEYDSWVIVNDDIAWKHSDKSFFEHGIRDMLRFSKLIPEETVTTFGMPMSAALMSILLHPLRKPVNWAFLGILLLHTPHEIEAELPQSA